MFFFSSRRRHTRWPRDWSSDVCSSDLDLDVEIINPDHLIAHLTAGGKIEMEIKVEKGRGYQPATVRVKPEGRSEERRVGKECRARGSADQCRKKQNI